MDAQSVVETPAGAPDASPAFRPSPTPSAVPADTCEYPTGWIAYVVHPGDTLAMLGAVWQMTPEALIDANCLSSSTLTPGSTIYVPLSAP